MAKPARHVAADAASDQDAPEERGGAVGPEMDEPAQAGMKDGEQAFSPMRPARVVVPFQDQQTTAGGNGKVMPEGELDKRDMQRAAPEKNRGHPDVAGAH